MFGLKRKKKDTLIFKRGNDTFEFEPISYDTVYDEDGSEVLCDICGAEMIWQNDQYTCSGCGQTMERSEFFNYIGAEPPGPECEFCDNLYPGCVVCPHGYVDI